MKAGQAEYQIGWSQGRCHGRMMQRSAVGALVHRGSAYHTGRSAEHDMLDIDLGERRVG